MFKKAILSTAVTTLALAVPFTSTFAATNTANLGTVKSTQHQFASNTFSAPVNLTDKQEKELVSKAVKAQPTNSYNVTNLMPDVVIKPNATSPNWSYTGLYPGHYIDQQASDVVTTNGEQVIVKIVQYPDAVIYGGAVADATYQLVAQGSGVTTSPYEVYGNYDSTNFTFSFYNVSAGTYKLRITNITNKNGADPSVETDMAGNGFVYYY